MSPEMHQPNRPHRPEDAHKGSMGRTVLLVGSRDYPGAAILSAHGASRGGAGLIQVAVPRSISGTVVSELPSVVICPLRETARGQVATTALKTMKHILQDAQSLVIGPGLGQSPSLMHLVKRVLLGSRPRAVVDADALNLLAQSLRTDLIREGDILTPHPKEAARLMGEDGSIDPSRRTGVAARLAEQYGCTVVLKGPRTRVAHCGKVALNDTGNAALATGGTGDVLAGLLGALLARGMSSLEAAKTGVWVHGAAADWMCENRGADGLQPMQLADALPRFLSRDQGLRT